MGLTNFLNYELCKFTSTPQLDETKPILCGLHLYTISHTWYGLAAVPDPGWRWVGHHGALELAESVRDDRGVAARLGAAEPRLLLLGELVLSDLDSDAKVKYPVKK